MAPIFDPTRYRKNELTEEEKLQRRIENYETRISAAGQEIPEPEKESNLLLKALDILDRPRNAILSGLTGQGFVAGLKGDTDVHVSDLLEDQVQNKYARGALGFVGDVLLDPLTYLSLGTAGVAKGAATQGGKQFLKVAGQPLADVTPFVNALKGGVQKTGLPELFGPVFSNKYVRRAVTSDEELPDVQSAVDTLRSSQRLITGQQQEAMDRLKSIYAGMPDEAAREATGIIEAPTQFRINRAEEAVREPRPRVTVRTPGQPAGIDDLVAAASNATRKTMDEPLFEDAVRLPEPGGIGGAAPTVKVPGLRMGAGEAFDIKPAQAADALGTEAAAVGVRTPQAIMDPIIQAARQGQLNKDELARALTQLSQDEQKILFTEISRAFRSQVPKPAREILKAADQPQVQFQGQTFTEKELLEHKSDIEKKIAGLETGLARYIRDTRAEAAKEGDIYKLVKERGGIRAGADLAEEYRTVIPLGLRSKTGLSMDEMASELGMTANDLLDTLRGRIPLAPPRLSDVIGDAVKMLELDEDYKTKLRAIAKIDELLGKVAPGEIPDEVKRLLPKLNSAEDVLSPEVVKQVDSFFSGVKNNKNLLEFFKKLEDVPGAKAMKDGAVTESVEGMATPTPKPNDLVVAINKALQVGFDKEPVPPGLAEKVQELFAGVKESGSVDKNLLNDILGKLPEKAQKDVFESIRGMLSGKQLNDVVDELSGLAGKGQLDGERLYQFFKDLPVNTQNKLVRGIREAGDDQATDMAGQLLKQILKGDVDKRLLSDALNALPVSERARVLGMMRQSVKGPGKDTLDTVIKEGTKAEARAADTRTGAEKLQEMIDASRKLGMETTAEGRAAAQLAKRITEETTAKDIAAGVEFDEVPDYVRHLYKDDPKKVRQVLNDWMKKQLSIPGRKAGFQKERKIPTAAEAKKLGLTPVEDIRILTTVREMEGIKQRGINAMYKELEGLGSNVVRPAAEAPAGWVSLPGIKQLEGKALHPEVARHLERFNSVMSSAEGMRTMATVLGSVQNFWKGLVTAPNPMFHVRNALGNAFNNFLGGVVNPEVYRLALVAQKGGEEVISLGGKQYTAKELRKVFREKGLEGFGFFKGESSQSIIKQAEESFQKESFKDKASLIKQGRKVGDQIESNAKMAHFIDRLNKGDTAEQAAKSVRKYLFDYGDLTDAEKAIRNFIPFYTFTRKNLPLQLENLITNPGKMTGLNKLVENMTEAQGVQEGDMPDWMRSEQAVPLGDNKNLMLDLPLNQLNMLGGGKTMENFVSMLTPLLKMPIETAFGRQVFGGQEIEKYPGATVDYGGFKVPAYLGYLLKQLGPMPRGAADVAGKFIEQQPNESYIPQAPEQIPFLASFIRATDPEREQMLKSLRRERQLGDFRKYLEEVAGIEVPEMKDIKKGRGLVF